MDYISAFHIAQQNSAFEPQRLCHFMLEVYLGDVAGQEAIQLSLASVSHPFNATEEKVIDYINEKIYYAGKTFYEPGTFSCWDFVDKPTYAALLRWRKQVYDHNTGKVGLSRDYKKTARLIMFGPDGSAERIWRLEGVWPVSVRGADFDMASADPQRIGVTFRYDKAIPEFVDNLLF